MGDFKRRSPEPQPGLPGVRRAPGMAAELMAELAPFLAEEGIDVNDIDVPDLATLQAAMGRAIERRELVRFTPTGAVREQAAAILRRTAVAIHQGDTGTAADILDAVPPEAPDAATVASCIGLGVGRLDEWLGDPGAEGTAPPRLADTVRLPPGHWVGERAATDLLALARKGRAFETLGPVIARQGGYHVLFGTALSVTAALQAWSRLTGTVVADLAAGQLR